MKNKYSGQEIIDLILNFYTFTQGYWKEEVELYTEIQKFVEDGYTCNDDKYQELIKPTEDGDDFLHGKIEEISQKFIRFMIHNNMVCGKEKVAEWFMNEFDLDGLENGEEIANYITSNLYRYGYRGCRPYSRRRGELYTIIKMS